MPHAQDSLDALVKKVNIRLQQSFYGPAYHYHAIDSTNQRALELGLSGSSEGTLVLATHQTRGRGRQGRTWHSPRGDNLYFSLVLHPDLPPHEVPPITLVAATAVFETLRRAGLSKHRVKWPNDLLIGQRKVAGILTEMETQGQTLAVVILGMGINISTPTGGFDPEIRDIATSINDHVAQPISREFILEELLVLFAQAYGVFLQNNGNVAWRGLSPHLRSIRVAATSNGAPVEGIAIGLSTQGGLLIKTDQGTLVEIISGEIEELEVPVEE